ncbi:hypothetical protein K8I28_06625 [bacterium]|nr:hypothetical protein [bacterium]
MKGIVRRFFDIRDGEWRRSFYLFAYIFLVIASLLILKPVRNSMFLTTFGPAKLPYGFILVAIVSTIVAIFYAKLVKRYRLYQLLNGNLILSTAILVLFWISVHNRNFSPLVLYLLYVWVAAFGVLTTSQFWLLANYVFNAREAKRLFSFLAAGGISGAIFGGYLTRFLVPLIGTENLLLICVIFLLCCIYLLKLVWGVSTSSEYQPVSKQKQIAIKEMERVGTLKLLLKSPNLLSIAGIMGVSVLVAHLVDYQFNAAAAEHFTDENSLTAFFGFWLSNLSIFSLVVQIFFSGRILKSFGVGSALSVLPGGILMGTVLMFLVPGLWAAVIVKVADGGFKQSINKSAYELLYLPIPREIKNRIKTFIDIFIDSIFTGIGGLILILIATILHFSLLQISIVTSGFLLLWFYLVYRAKVEYINSFRTAIEKRTLDLDETTIHQVSSAVLDNILPVLNSTNVRQLRYILKVVKGVKDDRLLPYLKQLINHNDPEVVDSVLGLAGNYPELDFSKEAEKLIFHPDENVRKAAIYYLLARRGKIHETLRNFFNHDSMKVRSAAMLVAAEVTRENDVLRNEMHSKNHYQWLLSETQSSHWEETDRKLLRSTCARAIGISQDTKLIPYLNEFILEEDIELKRAAVISAGQSRVFALIPQIVSLLSHRQLRRSARETLAALGHDALPYLEKCLSDGEMSAEIKIAIPRVLTMVRSQKSVDILLRHLKTSSGRLRYEIIIALSRLRQRHKELKFPQKPVLEQLQAETRSYYDMIALLNIFDRDGEVDLPERRLLMKTLKEKVHTNLERIFRMLSLRYNPDDMENAFIGIQEKNDANRANAVELLDNVLDLNLKRLIIPIAEIDSIEALSLRSETLYHFHYENEEECLQHLTKNEDSWLASCALKYTVLRRYSWSADRIEEFAASDDFLLQDTSQITIPA